MKATSPRRHEILRAAERLFEHYGPGKTTIADVAREARVGVGTVYLEFSCKDAIVEELARQKHESVIDAMRAAAARADLSFDERVMALFDARLEAYYALIRGGQHACDLMHCGATARALATEQARVAFQAEERALLTEVLRMGVRARELDSTDCELTARAVLACYGTFTPPAIFGVPEREARLALGAVHVVVLSGIRRRRR